MKPTLGSPLRPMNQACHGVSQLIHGTSNASAWSDTGITLSALEAAMRISTLVFWMRSPATWLERFELDWLSSITVVILCILPSPHTTPSPITSLKCSRQYLSAAPKEANGPVSGPTKPSLISRPCSAAALTVVVLPGAAPVVVVAAPAVVVVAAAAVVVVASSLPHAATRPAESGPEADRGPRYTCDLQKVPAAYCFGHASPP